MERENDDLTRSNRISLGRKLGQYRVISFVGAGGMGEVYLARDEKLDRLVALKTLSPHLAAIEQHRRRFLNEARASARLTHKNICQVYAIEEEGELLFISMEYVQGSVLKEIIAQKPIPPDHVRDIAVQCCEGFRAAHDQRIIHRDVKSSNIMLDKYGTVKILDFGLAKFLDDGSITKTSAIMGTYKYMSPEQITGESLDARSDLFSLGIVLFEAITGQLPFEGDNAASVAYAIVHGELPKITTFTPGCPEDLIQIVERALKRKPLERYQSAEEMLRDLRQGFSGAVAASPSVGLSSASLAVFPFRNLSRSEDDLYLAEGLCDEVITSLAKIPQVKVASRSAVSRFSGKDFDPIEIATQLKVGHFVEGSLRRAGDKIHLNIQLTRIEDGFLVWSESYEKMIDFLFNMQTEIAHRIALALNVKPTTTETTGELSGIRIGPRAYDLYLQAKFHLKRRDEASINRGITLLQQAVEADPKFASAYGELAMAVGLAVGYGFSYPPEYEGKLQELADQAISLNPGSSQAHMSLFFFHRFHDMNRGISELRTALALDSSNFEAYHLLSHAYMFSGLYNAALRAEEAANQLDPFQEMSDAHLARIFYFSGEEEQAIKRLEEMEKKYPDSFIAHSTRGWIHWVRREWQEALKYYLKAYERDRANLWTVDHVCDCHIRLGNIDEAAALMDQQLDRNPGNIIALARKGLIARKNDDLATARRLADLAHSVEHKEAEKRGSVNSAIYYFDLAWIDALCGFKGDALQHLKSAVDSGYGHYGELRLRPDWDIIQNEPEFIKMLADLEARCRQTDADIV